PSDRGDGAHLAPADEILDGPSLSRHLEEAAALIENAEIICGIPSYNNSNTIANVVRAVEAGLRRRFPDVPTAIVISDGSSGDGTMQAAIDATTVGEEEPMLISASAPIPQRLAIRYRGISGKGSAFRTIFTLAEMTSARAIAVFDADLRSITPHWVENLVAPVIEHGQDFVAPVYARHKYDGTITNAIAFPLTAALYGVKLRQPIGGEFGFSRELASHWSRQAVWATDVARYGIDIWMTTVALTEGFRVAQANLGAKVHDPKDPGSHLAPMFRQVVGSLFALAGRYVPRWHDIESMGSVPTYGFRAVTTAEDVRVRAGRLTWRFIEGYMRYEKLWREILAPSTMAEVSHATDQAAERTEGFALPAELWAQVVYDYLVAYNAKMFDVSLLLDSMIPLYFARTATFVHEARGDDQDAAEERIERYAKLFMERKPYLRARWDEVGVQRSLAEQRVTPEGDEPEAEELGAQSA
ncbi:MAG TPA: glycosyltransferase, partial [Actinomycetota bacterium]|nr:glycosyltransferase [Actinomycetota bacterium]